MLNRDDMDEWLFNALQFVTQCVANWITFKRERTAFPFVP